MKAGLRMLTLLVALFVGAVIMYFASHRGMHDINQVLEGKYRLMKQAELDSLSAMIERLQIQRRKDSLELSIRLKSNKEQIQHLKNDIQKIDFRDYTDSGLDSLVEYLYPKPRR